MMITPPLLVPGDMVGLIAPGRKVREDEIAFAERVLSSWGLRARRAQNMLSNYHSYLAGSDEERRADFHSMVNDDEVRAIMCMRGGYGSTRIIDDIDFTSLVRVPKWIIGFSDVTAIQLKGLSINLCSIHSLMPIQFARPEYASSLDALRGILFNGTSTLRATPHPLNRPGTVSAQVVGGNLSLLADSLGTPTALNSDGKILILEEIDEYRYRVDRMITQLRRAGKFKNLAGLVIGHMTDIKDTETSFGQTVDEILTSVVSEYRYPVGLNFPTGHDHPNFPWIQGATATLDINTSGSSLIFSKIINSGKV